jgi:pimeloyl-ACP methyl ester carboxylesterase
MTAKADYEETNAAGFATNAKRLPSFIDQALGEALAERLTVTKVDVVAHSMGGLITREYCLQKPDDCKRQIHKFITIDTPHTGTEIANEVIKVGLDPAERSCKETVISDGLHARNPPNRVDEGAVFDLAKDSQAIQRLALTPIIVPSHTIAGGTPLGAASTFPVPLTPDVIFSIPLFFAYDPDLAYLWTGLHIYCNRVPNREFLVGDQHTKVVFPDGGDDRLVPVVSQLGGLTGNGVSMPFTDVDHVTVHDRERVAREVIRLLEASPTGAAFQGTGFWGGLR